VRRVERAASSAVGASKYCGAPTASVRSTSPVIPSAALGSDVNENELWCQVCPSASGTLVTVSPNVQIDRPQTRALPPPSRPTISEDCETVPISFASTTCAAEGRPRRYRKATATSR
jgi:hypothetical protein